MHILDGKGHDPPAPGAFGVQDAVPGHSELRVRPCAGAAHLEESSRGRCSGSAREHQPGCSRLGEGAAGAER